MLQRVASVHHGSVGPELGGRVPPRVAVARHGGQQESLVLASWPKTLWKFAVVHMPQEVF